MTTREPWDDDRLAAAFATRAAGSPRARGLPETILARLRTPERPATRWHGLVGPLAIAALLIAAIAGGAAILGQPDRATDPPVTFRAGPTAEVWTLDAGTFSFRYPAGWHAYDATAESAGGSSIAVLGNVAVDPACLDEGHVEAACVHARPLGPGEIRMNVGTGTLQDGTLETRRAITNGTTTRLEVAGQPAILDDIGSNGDDFYGADVSLHLYLAMPGDGTRIVLVDVIARDPDAGAAREAMQEVVDSFRFAGVPAPSGPAPTADGSPVGEDGTVFGLPIRSVAEAIEIRDGGVDAREVAVTGWFSPIAPVSCPYTAVTSPVQPACPDQWIVLMAEPESLVTVSANELIMRSPTGPALQVEFDGLDTSWQPALPDVGQAAPIELVVVGHFDDERSTACPPAEVQACRDRFVVDHVASAAGRPLSRSEVRDPARATMTAAAVIASLEGVVRDDAVLSLTAVPTEELAAMEPGVGVEDAVMQYGPGSVWVVRALAGERAVRYLVTDPDGDAYRMDAGVPVALTPGQPPARPTTAPSSPVTTIELAGEEDPPVMVRIVDAAGVVSGAQPADAATIAGPDWDGRPQVLRVQPRTVLVRWIGSPCDSVIDLTVTRTADDGLEFRLAGDRPACDSIGVPGGSTIGLGGGAGGPLTLVDERTTYLFPDPVAGLQVLDVRQAQDLQARDGDDREIAVFGWYERPAAVCLGFDADLPLLDPGCRQQAVLRARPDTRAPVPAIPVVVVAEDGADDRLDGTLRRAVMVGHFDDRRTVACEPARREACRATFVVDAMWLDDERVPPAWAWTPPSGPAPFEPDATPTRAGDRARDYVDAQATILGVGLVPMESLRRLEPTIDELRLQGAFWHWHVTVLEPRSGRVRTFIVPDASLGASDDFTAWEVVGGEAVPAHLVGTSQSPGAS